MSNNGNGNLRTPEEDAQAFQREELAFTLRCQGASFDTIAAKCGYANRAAAHKAYRRAISRIPVRSINEMRETIFAQQMYALQCLAPKIRRGDTWAIHEMTAIHDRMAKLFGLDRPVEVEVVPPSVIIRAYPPEWINALPAVEPALEAASSDN